jgi:bifunctional UDP-N-acetylglucosamine pyrophosphorylase/glucosamine-1-phosphate N-acetyltransferase
MAARVRFRFIAAPIHGKGPHLFAAEYAEQPAVYLPGYVERRLIPGTLEDLGPAAPREPREIKSCFNAKAVLWAAGESSRFWPLSEGGHKSLFKLMGKPLIQWTIEGLKKAGFEEIIVIQGSNRVIEQAFGDGSRFGLKLHYVIQPKPKGMAEALLRAEDLIKDRFFALYAHHFDAAALINAMLVKSQVSGAELVLAGQETNTPWEYGALDLRDDKAIGIIEKPEKGQEPSKIRPIGIYLLPKSFFDSLRKVKTHMYGYEDALQLYMQEHDARVVIANQATTSLKYPWDLFAVVKILMDSFLTTSKISPTAEISKSAIIEGKVHIGDYTKVYEHAVIKGPCYIGNGCTIGTRALIRDYTVLEDGVLIGAHAEVTRSIFQEGCTTHSGFFGDSIFSRNCKIGAGTITANTRVDRGEIKSIVKNTRVETGLKRLGVIVGDNSRIGILTMLMPGALIGRNCDIGPGTLVKDSVDSDTLYYSRHEVVANKKKM